MIVSSLCTSWNMCCHNFPTVSEMMFGCLDDVVCIFDLLNLLMKYELYV
jgi:hypothetical protein